MPGWMLYLPHNNTNLPELLGLGAAIDYRNQIDQDRIHDRSYALKQYFLEQLATDDRFVVKTPGPDDLSAAIQTVEVQGKSVGKVRAYLRDEHQIDCRPMTSHDLNGVRISLAIFITKRDIDYLVEGLGSV